MSNSYEYITDLKFRHPHFSLDVLETFFENDASNQQSVKPLIQKYIDYVSLPTDQTVVDEYGEQSLSHLLDSLTDMPHQKRQEIFGQDNLASLTIFITILIKNDIETSKDVQAILGNQERIDKIGAELEKKGYINKFIYSLLEELFGRREMVKRKEKMSDLDSVGEKPIVPGAVPQVFQTATRRVQIFPAVAGAGIWLAVAVISFALASLCAAVGQAVISQYDVSIAAQCAQTLSQYGATAVAPICGQNSNYPIIGYCILTFALLFVIILVIASIKGFKIIAHNQFANTHNNFELVHHEFTKVVPTQTQNTQKY